MATKVKIEKITYFGEETHSTDFNGKVLYRKNGKLHLAHVWIDFWNKEIFISKNQPKECKVLSGLGRALNENEYFKL